MDALGRLFDIGLGWAPVDLDTANAATGKRLAMQGARGCTIVAVTAAGGATAAVFTLKQHTAYTGGTSADLAAITRWTIKTETVLDNDEAWVTTTQAAVATVSLDTTYGDDEYILVIEVDARQMSDGYSHISLDFAATLGAPKLGACLYFPHELRYQRKPSKLPNLLRPGVANA
jgi:hypothetical protein